MTLTILDRISESWVKLDTLDTDAEFLLKPLDSMGQMAYGDAISVAINNDHGNLSTGICQVVIERGLLDWRGLKDTEGDDVPFNKLGSFSEKINGLPILAIKAIASEIIERSQFGEEVKKK